MLGILCRQWFYTDTGVYVTTRKYARGANSIKTSSFFPSKVKLQAGSDSKQQLLFCGSDNGTEELPLTANPEVKGLEIQHFVQGPS